MPRSTCEIVSDILETVQNEENCKRTNIIKLANLDWKMAKRSLDYLIKKGYLETYEDNSKGKESFRISENGEELLSSINNVKGMCEDLE